MSKHELDRIAERYHASAEVPDKHIEDLCQEYCGSWILESMGKAQRVLELGFGEGIITRLLVEDGRQVTTVEGSGVLFEQLRQTFGGSVHAVRSMFEHFVPEHPFEAVVASHILEHVDHPVALLKRMRGWIAPGGKLIIVVPNRESLHRRLAVIMGLQPELDTLSPRDLLVGHQRVYSLAGLERDLQEAGLNAAVKTGFFLKPLANSMMLGYSTALLQAMNQIAPQVPVELLANIGVVAVDAD